MSCGPGSPGFPAVRLLAPGSAETGTDAPANLLREEIGRPLEENDLPQTGWVRIEIPPDAIQFIASSPTGWKIVSVQLGPTGWITDQYGSCALRPVPPAGLNAASWWIDPDGAALGPTSTRVEALILEEACASGKPPVGRVVGPVIDDLADRVIVTFAVRTQPGGRDCPGNPPLAVPFDLPTPLGTRPLFDGGQFPPRDASIPAL